jgi:hypothetical protein
MQGLCSQECSQLLGTQGPRILARIHRLTPRSSTPAGRRDRKQALDCCHNCCQDHGQLPTRYHRPGTSAQKTAIRGQAWKVCPSYGSEGSMPAACPTGRATAASHGHSRTLHRRVRGSGNQQAASRQRHRLPKLMVRVAVWAAVHHRAPQSRADRSRTLVQLEPIRTAVPRAANAAHRTARKSATAPHDRQLLRLSAHRANRDDRHTPRGAASSGRRGQSLALRDMRTCRKSR